MSNQQPASPGTTTLPQGPDRTLSGASGAGNEDKGFELVDCDLDTAIKCARKTASYRVTCALTLPSVPVLAALLSIVADVIASSVQRQLPWQQQWTPLIIVLGGSLSALIIWLIIAIPWRRFAAVDRANMSSYGYLLNCLHQVQPKLQMEKKRLGNGHGDLWRDESVREALALYQSIIREIQRENNPSWMAAIGYVNIWRCMHYIYEAFSAFEPIEDVLSDAVHDKMCIEGSNIRNSKDLLAKIDVAYKTLTKDTPVSCVEENQARASIRQVRHELYQFRDDRWENLVRIRNHLLRMTTLIGSLLYFLCIFALLSFPQELPKINIAVILFFIGSISGVFGRLYSQSKTDTSIDDYELASARLIAGALYSGLAALGGVFITQGIGSPGNFNPFVLTLPNILSAATFGLTPVLLVSAIQKEAEQNKKDLKSTAPEGKESDTKS